MRLTFAFGRAGLALNLPDGYQYRVLEPHTAQALPDAAKAIDAALDAPVGTAPLTALAQGKQSAAISVCDITRPAPNRVTLPHVLRRLAQAGIPRERTTLCIATGLHRLATPRELDEILGADLVAQYPVYNHNAREPHEHTDLGSTATGTPVHIAAPFIAADLRITLGFIEPHLMAGFSGGRKLVAPGLAAEATIKVLHSPRFMRDRHAVEGVIENNPLHRELLAIARLAKHDFVLDVALTRDRRIAQVFAGHPEQAHAAGVRYVSQTMLQSLPEPVPVAITSAAGYPLDLTFYQAIKGVTAAAHVVAPGGHIVLLAECQEGAGAPEFQDMMGRCATAQDFLTLLAQSPVVVDQWQLEKLALVMRDKHVHFFTPGIPPRSWWGTLYPSAAAALSGALAAVPVGSPVAVIPEGPYVLAKAA